jgi:hypothetical protein
MNAESIVAEGLVPTFRELSQQVLMGHLIFFSSLPLEVGGGRHATRGTHADDSAMDTAPA